MNKDSRLLDIYQYQSIQLIDTECIYTKRDMIDDGRRLRQRFRSHHYGAALTLFHVQSKMILFTDFAENLNALQWRGCGIITAQTIANASIQFYGRRCRHIRLMKILLFFFLQIKPSRLGPACPLERTKAHYNVFDFRWYFFSVLRTVLRLSSTKGNLLKKKNLDARVVVV